MPDNFRQSTIPGTDLLLKLYQIILDSPSPSPSNLLERWREQKEFDILSRLLEWDIPDAEHESQKQQLFSDALNRLQRQHRDQRLQALIDKSHQQALTRRRKSRTTGIIHSVICNQYIRDTDKQLESANTLQMNFSLIKSKSVINDVLSLITDK